MLVVAIAKEAQGHNHPLGDRKACKADSLPAPAPATAPALEKKSA